MKPTVLLIDDDDSLRLVTLHNLETGGFAVLGAASGEEGLALFRKKHPDVVITDVRLGDMDGIDLLGRIKEESPDTPVIVITAFGSIDMAVEAMRRGAFNFLAKPFDREALRAACRKAAEVSTLKARSSQLDYELRRLTGSGEIVTATAAMRELIEAAARVAASEATVLITGESGTGKEVLARFIHQRSPRSQGPLVTVNCAAIPAGLMESELFGHVKGAFTGAVKDRRGRFQLARHGTLFLDEIGELDLPTQAKLLRAVQEREVEPVGGEAVEAVDVRIVCATNRDLQKMVAEGGFREDLYYRLAVVPLSLPPLRERLDDIPLLVELFLRRFNAPVGVRFSPEALARLREHHWPGNVRELQNVVERALIMRRGEVIEAADLAIGGGKRAGGFEIPDIPDEGISLDEVERELVRRALAKAGGNRAAAARLLGIERHKLLYRLEKYGIGGES